MSATYEVLALKYAELNRTRGSNFLNPDDDHASPMPMDYFLWVIRNDKTTIVFDTGFDRAEGARRGRNVLIEPQDVLATVGVDARLVDTVAISHMHYDHAGTLGNFPSARFHLQEAEMQFCTGHEMLNDSEQQAFTSDHVKTMVDMVFDKRVTFLNGEGEIAEGISLHPVPGHTAGMQCMRVPTERGWVVLASDAAHFYENWTDRNPFSICWSLEKMFESFDRIEELADSEDHVIPGHDPLVRSRYPAASDDLAGWVTLLHASPTKD